MKALDWVLPSVLLACLAIVLPGCGGGGGGNSGGGGGSSGGATNSPLMIAFDADELTFSTDAPFNGIALTQRIKATVTSTGQGTATGTLYVLVEVPSDAFFTVPEVQIDSQTEGHAVVQVKSPQEMGAGAFESSFRVRACLNSANCSSGEIKNSPHTIRVHYEVGDVVDGDTVMPRVVNANAAGSVILRGHGFTSNSTVTFGGTPATSVRFVSSTELRAGYPALPAGSYPVAVNSGATQFNAAVSMVAATNYSYAWIPHLTSGVFFPSALVYDAEHQAFTFAGGANATHYALRYVYSGNSWVQSGRLDDPWVSQLRMSHDGSRIVALHVDQYGTNTMLDLDPATLAIEKTTTVDANAWSFVLSNDGNYVIATKFPGSGYMPPVLLGSTRAALITAKPVQIDAPAAVASGDGSKVVVFGQYGDAGVYDSSMQTFTVIRSTQLRGSWDYARLGSANLDGTRFTSFGVVVDQNLQVIGTTDIDARTAVISPDGTRLYVYDQGGLGQGPPIGKLHIFDVNTTTSATPYPHLAEIGSPIVLANNPNGTSITDSPMQIALVPDARAVIICGLAGCVVQPTPP